MGLALLVSYAYIQQVWDIGVVGPVADPRGGGGFKPPPLQKKYFYRILPPPPLTEKLEPCQRVGQERGHSFSTYYFQNTKTEIKSQ